MAAAPKSVVQAVREVKAENDGQVPLDLIRTAYIAEGLSPGQIATRYYMPAMAVRAIIKEERLPALRRAHIRNGLQNLQNTQIHQAKTIMDLEVGFKKFRIIQLKARLKDYMAYFEVHGDFYKRNPITQEILLDLDGIPMQIRLPDASVEMRNIKDSVVMSEGIKRILKQIELVLKGEDTTEGALTVEDFFMAEDEE